MPNHKRVKSPTSQPTSKPPAQDSSTNSRVVACTKCDTRLSVKVMSQPSLVTCPKCQTKLRIGGAAPKQETESIASSRGPSNPPPTPPNSRSSRGASSHPAAPLSETSGSLDDVDLGQMDLGAADAAPPVNANPYVRKAPVQKRSEVFFKWVNAHRWVSALIAMNIIAWLLTAMAPFMIVIALSLSVTGVPLIGLMFLPRFHTIEKISSAIGPQLASAGVGGIFLAILLGTVKLIRRSNRNPNVDLSLLLDPNNFGSMLISLGTGAFTTVTFVVLWWRLGLVRMLACGYTCLWMLMIPVFIFGIARGDLEPRGGPRDFSDSRVETGTGRGSFARTPTDQSMRSSGTFDRGRADRLRRGATVQPMEIDLGVRRRKITIPLPNGGKIVQANTKILKGDRLQACWAGNWYNVTVVNANQDGTIKVKWDDWNSVYDMVREDLVTTH